MALPKINLSKVALTSRPRQHLQSIQQSPSKIDGMKSGGNISTLKHLLFDTFGVPYTAIDRALDGDTETIKQLGALASRCERISENAPNLKDAMSKIINGTVAQNVTVAEILRDASAGALQIQAARIGLGQALDAYQFQSWNADERAKSDNGYQESVRKALISLQEKRDSNRALKQSVDATAQLTASNNQTAIWQLQADREYQKAHIAHSWEYGDAANHALLPKKEYGLVAQVTSFFQGWMSGE